MPMLRTQIPQLSRHIRGQAFVKIAGQQIWLGKHGDPLTHEKYDRLVAEWLANGRTLPAPAAPAEEPATVLHLIAPYWRWAKQRYTASEADTIKSALRVVEKLYGSQPAIAFGPNALRAVRAEMIRKGWTRRHINKQISRVRALFRWAASHELVSESIYNQLRTVEPLRLGEAPERPRVKPVPRNFIRSVRHRVSRQVRALMNLQLLTGARAGELIKLKPADIDCSRPDVWSYHPQDHKTAHHEKERWIYFGPRARKILKMFMTSDSASGGFLFSPSDAVSEKHKTASIHRRPNQKPNARQTDRVLGLHYTTASYRRALHRAMCEAFPVPKGISRDEAKNWRRAHTWGPHSLRHNAGTFLRREFGIEIARVILGHSSAATTLIYAEQDERRAMQAIAKVG